ncbi:polyprenyl synthetase family protein [Microbacterium sp. LRZ72]|uniref:polyprenyl synthetase family protein n=1 Tax=Microbacterium sp. LRZ72 TaxID=2942481 RepID=UPI0029B75969|nr:polyprenyl synthetase family protein [Microbacterium sp. LRZ72]MDX2375727.1 polyprenyl synthetase family protein [Microbacterium sp. LRZ72]
MTPLSSTFLGERRAEVDDAIDLTIDRIAERMKPFGGAFADLGAAMRRTAAGGKRFRPTLVVAVFEALGGDADQTPALFPVAASFELLHAAFLMHDDILDHDTERRGVPNVSGEFRAYAERMGTDAAGAALLGEAAGLLAGDLLLHESQRLIALAPVTPDARERLLDLLDEAVLVSAAGELADVAHSLGDEAPEAAAVLAATHDKTAVYSFAAPLRAGAVLADAGEEAERALATYGSRLGLAFQLVDDLIGAFGSAAQAGKAEGADLREAKKTALIALARASAAWPDVRAALADAHTGPIAVRRAQTALGASGARAQLESLVATSLADARAVLDGDVLPPAARTLLAALADAVEARIP